MPLTTLTNTVTYPGDGVVVALPIPFDFADAADLRVVKIDALGAETLLSNLFHYTVNGSTLHMAVAPAVGTSTRIDRVTPLTQPDSLRNPGAFYPATVEGMINRTVMQVQDLARKIQGLFEAPADTQLRGNLASPDPGAGADMVAHADSLIPVPYLKTVSDTLNGLEVSLHRFIAPNQLSAIRAGTSTYDCGDDIREAFAEEGVRALLIPAGRHNYSGALPRTGGLALRGVSSRHSILRCVDAGGIVFTGGDVAANPLTMPTLDLAQLRILAATPNAGTAVTMGYTGGGGYAQLGPNWVDVAIEAEAVGHGFQIACRGTNVRDMHIKRVTVAGSNANPGYPADYTMLHGFLMDGASDPVELWFSDFYAYYIRQCIEVGGHYEGIYIDHAHTVGAHHFLKWDSAVPNPVAMISDSYIATERSGVDLNRVSYFRIQNNVFNPTAPVADANYNGVIVRRTVGDQTQASDIMGNSFIGVGYSSVGAFTETACLLENANTVAWHNNTVYDMDVGIKGIAGTGNRIGPNNRYINVTTPEDVPRTMRWGNTFPECNLRVTQGAAQTIAVNTDVKLLWDTPLSDPAGAFDAGTGRWTPASGAYDCVFAAHFNTGVVVGDQVFLELRKNNTPVAQLGCGGALAGSLPAMMCAQVDANGSDYFELWCYYVGASGTRTRMALSTRNYWHATMVH